MHRGQVDHCKHRPYRCDPETRLGVRQAKGRQELRGERCEGGTLCPTFLGGNTHLSGFSIRVSIFFNPRKWTMARFWMKRPSMFTSIGKSWDGPPLSLSNLAVPDMGHSCDTKWLDFGRIGRFSALLSFSTPSYRLPY